ncbi:replicative DNA helicase [Desulfobacula sp.]|uniref:Replicative DNA helicase n=1 Tax=Candidatus Desulfatibia vada TaxID=2841696 RepID=A0A8J6TMB5_9BACT|nr:replicative DNA helicase [Candidatus Desulfatibia vada]MBL6994150.1 replicative DNA helicase [Desulfobacula sp.]
MSHKIDPHLYRLPPHNLEAEESLISAILVDNSTLNDIIEILSSDDFYRTVHKEIFTAIVDLYVKNEPVDLVTLSNKLRETGKLEAVGGVTFLAKIVDTVQLAVNARHYARIVHDKARLRRLIEKSNKIIEQSLEDKGDIENVLDFASSSIFEIAEDRMKKTFIHLSDIIEHNYDDIEKWQKDKSLATGVPTGFKQLDSLTLGFQTSDLIIIAARPSMGKTAFALNIARNAAVEENIPVAFFSLEMSEKQLGLRMLCSEAAVDSYRVKHGFLGQKDFNRLSRAAGILSGAPIYIDDAPNNSAMDIRSKARRLKMESEIGLIVIDYLQLLKIRQHSERRDLDIAEISKSLKALAKELDLPVVALSQLNRKLEERKNKRPKLSDLRESGALEQDADVVIFIYRDEVYKQNESNPDRGIAEILLSKHRNGQTGIAKLAFLSEYTRFENLAHEYGSTSS